MDENAQSVDQIPSRIGRYEIQECVGYGAMGAVYKAFDPLIKRTLAIKTLRLDAPRNAPQYRSFIERFEHEARISGTLNHPNIVTLFDVGEEGGLPFLAMEFVPGDTIASLIERGVRFDPERVIGLVSQIASAVDYAHAKGVIHRDIKPSNLILADGDNVKVTDFGIAKLVDADMTQSGVLLGTPSYMSPEQAMGEKLDGRSDIFSLGVCAFEMLSGEQPFPGNNVTSILYKLVHVDPIEPASLEMSGLIPQKWREVFGKVLAKKPDDRYQRAAEFVHDLEYCLGSWFGAAMGEETVLTPVPLAAAPTAPTGESADVAGDASTVVVPALASGSASAKRAAARTQPIPVVAPPAAPAPEDSTVVARPSGVEPASAVTSTPASATSAPTEEDVTVMVSPAQQATSQATAPITESSFVAGRAEASDPDAATVLMGAIKSPAVTANSASVASRAEPSKDHVATVLMGAVAPGAARAEGEGATLLVPGLARGATSSAEAAHKGGGRSAPHPRRAAPPTATQAALRPNPANGRPPAALPRRSRALPRTLLFVGGALAILVAAVATAAFVLWHRTTASAAASGTPSPIETAARATPAPVTDGFLRITTRPTGAEITINGEPRGSTPFEGRLPLGLYDVQIALAGYETQARTVDLTTAKPKADLDLTLQRTTPQPTATLIDVTSTPSEAAVSIDGVEVGMTPLQGVEVAPGDRRVDISKPGYAATSRMVKAQAGRRAAVDVTLVAALSTRATPRPAPTPVPVDTSRVYEARQVDTPPQKLSGDSPDSTGALPRMKRGQRISVTVTFVVDENGGVANLEIVESQGGERLNQAVMDAVQRWRFAPGVKSGVKVKVRDTRKFTYQAG